MYLHWDWEDISLSWHFKFKYSVQNAVLSSSILCRHVSLQYSTSRLVPLLLWRLYDCTMCTLCTGPGDFLWRCCIFTKYTAACCTVSRVTCTNMKLDYFGHYLLSEFHHMRLGTVQWSTQNQITSNIYFTTTSLQELKLFRSNTFWRYPN